MFKKGNEVQKVVFLLSSPFNQQDKERFGVEILGQNGFKVEVWDFTPFLNPWRWKKYPLFDKSNFETYRFFLKREEALCAVSELTKDCLIVCIINYSYETYFLYRVISRYRLPYCLIAYNFISFDMKPTRNIFKRLGNLSLEKLRGFLFLKMPYKLLGIKPAKILLLLGGKLSLAGLPVDKTTEIIRSHYFDYDVYLEEIRKPTEPDARMAVFLDNYIPFHPDWGPSVKLDPVEYYPLLCNFFDLLERKYGVQMVVAAHPRSAYENLPDYFNGRPVVKGKTVELVRRSKFVVVHHSASVNFAVLFNKPLFFVTTDKLQLTQIAKIIDFMASRFNKSVINLSNALKLDIDHELMVDEVAYKKYLATYIKQQGTENLPIWQVFSNNLKNVKKSKRTYHC